MQESKHKRNIDDKIRSEYRRLHYEIKSIFGSGIQKLREYEEIIKTFDAEKFKMNYLDLSEKIKEVVKVRENV